MNISDIVAQSVADIPETDETVETAPQETDAEVETVEAAPQDAAPDVTPEPVVNPNSVVDPDLGISPRNTEGRENRLPYSRLRAIMDRAAKTHETELADYKTRVEKHEAERVQYEAQVNALRVAEENPEQFLKAIAQADPRYAKLLAHVFEAAPEAGANGNGGATQQDKPQPDMLNSDGSLTYSAEGFERLADWKAEQRVKALDAQYAERFGPMEKQFKTDAYMRVAVPKVKAQIADAEQWPQFTENKDEILKKLQSDRGLSLSDAYRQVVMPKLATNRDTMRASILAEINRKPKAATRVIPAGAGVAGTSEPRDIHSIIRDSIEGL